MVVFFKKNNHFFCYPLISSLTDICRMKRTNGKPGKVAVIAVANKLVRPAFAVVTHERPYVDGYVSTIDSAETSLGVEG